MMAWALFCHDFDLSKGINILSEKCPVVLDHYKCRISNYFAGVHYDVVAALDPADPTVIVVTVIDTEE